MNVKCSRCGKSWTYRGKKVERSFFYISCPECRYNIKVVDGRPSGGMSTIALKRLRRHASRNYGVRI